MREIAGKRASFARLTDRHGGVEGVAAAIRIALSVAPDETVESARAELFEPPAFPATQLRDCLEALPTGTVTEHTQAAKHDTILCYGDTRDRVRDLYL